MHLRFRRLIPSLLLRDKMLYKTTKFKRPVYLGDPLNGIRIFNESMVDEISITNICSDYSKGIDFDYLESLSSECFSPMMYSGKLRTLEQVDRIFASGYEKIGLHTTFINGSSLISQVAAKYGSQAVCVVLDIYRSRLTKKIRPSLAKPKSLIHFTDYSLIDVMKRAEEEGAGEIKLQSVTYDGTFDGPDPYLLNHDLYTATDLPVVTCGGVRNLDDVKTYLDAGADAVSAGSFFVQSQPTKAVLLSYPSKQEMAALAL